MIRAKRFAAMTLLFICSFSTVSYRTSLACTVNERIEEHDVSGISSHYDKYEKYMMSKNKTKKMTVYNYIRKKIHNGEIINNLKQYDFEKELIEFQSLFRKRIKKYNSIAKAITKKYRMLLKQKDKKNKKKYGKASIPGKLVAALHYRENTSDFKAGSFNIDLEDGSKLNIKNKKKRKKEFISKAAKLFFNKRYYVWKCNLKANTRDLVAMVTFTLFQNGAYDFRMQYGEPHWWGHSGYAFNGTNLYSIGTFPDDNVYKPNKYDKQLGTILLIDVIDEM